MEIRPRVKHQRLHSLEVMKATTDYNCGQNSVGFAGVTSGTCSLFWLYKNAIAGQSTLKSNYFLGAIDCFDVI